MVLATLAPNAEPFDFYDVRDPAAFVHANINKWCRPTARRGAIVLSIGEHEELHAEGMAIMCKLARDFQPHIDGYEHAGRFSGFAAMFLARKLGDAWHRLHEEHQLLTDNDSGKRGWFYGERSVSLDALTAEDPDGHGLLAAPAAALEIATWLRRALWEDAERLIVMTVDVARLRARHVGDEQIACELGLDRAQLAERVRHIEAVAPALRERVPLAEALRRRAEGQIELAVGVGELLAEGSTPADVAELLELDPGIVRDCVLMIARVRAKLESFANGGRAG